MIDREALQRHFPVHAVFDAQLRVMQLGSALVRHHAPAVGAPFSASFELERPWLPTVDAPALRQLGPTLCVVRFGPRRLTLRGEFVAAPDGGVVLLGSPAISDLADLSPNGLTLRDFASHDPTADFLMLMVSHRATVEDLTRTSLRLTQRTVELEGLNHRLAEATAAARQASAVKSRFLSNVSHELRTPLHAISGLSRLLREVPLPAEPRAWVEGVHDSSELLVSLIGQVLDLAKIEAGRVELAPAPVQLSRMLDQALAASRVPATGKGLCFEVSCEGLDVWVNADATRLQEVLLNLVSNAIKFTDAGSVRVAARFDGARLTVTVTDTGRGLSATQLEQLFVPFSQARKGDAGTGLGLAISRELATLHGGSLTCRSAPGQGSTFTLEVPLEPAPQPRSRSRTARAANQARRLKVLVVDDNPLNRLLGRKLLEREGHEVTVAEGGLQALERVEPWHDLVLMDLQMPDLDGVETLLELRRRGCEVPVVALTANALATDRRRCLEAGMLGYLVKPLDLEALREVLRSLPTTRRRRAQGRSSAARGAASR